MTRPDVDVCYIVEGCYPFIAGGVSSWLDWLIRSQEHLRFGVLAIVSGTGDRMPRYRRPDNLAYVAEVNLADPTVLAQAADASPPNIAMADALARDGASLVCGGGLDDLARILARINSPARPLSLPTLLNSPFAWEVAQRMSARLTPEASFLQFFWAWRALFGGLFAVAKAPLPRARVYHALSTGYAGLLGARATLETGRPLVITEHGIYTNERRIDVLMANWLTDTIDKGLSVADPRRDVRDIWFEAFEAYARAGYDAARIVTTLYSDNQILQRAGGAAPETLRVIANGIDVAQFAAITRAGREHQPTIALIGRVVPIKDVRTYIQAAALLKEHVPDVRALVMGPTNEDADYFAECQALVREYGLEDTVVFTGNVRIADYLPHIHVVVLTSLSEAQPLVLLEAGAAGIPCVTTNVGCCRELLEGAADEEPPIGRGGYVTDAVAPEQTAAAVKHLLLNHREREEAGNRLRARVSKCYTAERARTTYRALYAEAMESPLVEPERRSA